VVSDPTHGQISTALNDMDGIQADGSHVPPSRWIVEHAENYGPLRILSVQREKTHNTMTQLSMQALWHIAISDGSTSRDYTPLLSTLSEYESGRMKLFIKVYPQGQLTSRLFASSAPGDQMWIGPPEPTLSPEQEDLLWKSSCLGLIAAGTGLTPILQALVHAKQTQVRQVAVLCSSSTAQEARCALELSDGLHETAQIFHTITGDQPPSDWQGFSRRMDAQMLRDTMPPADPETSILVSGPNQMMQDVRQILMTLGYAPNAVIELDA
jgi:ferredoxin-NADP reductase